MLEEVLKRRGIEWRGENYDYEKDCHLNTLNSDDDDDDEYGDDDGENIESEDNENDSDLVIGDKSDKQEVRQEAERGEEDFSSRYLEDGRVVMK